MAAGARIIHVDVMDGHFVPPITIGPLVASSISDQVHEAGGAIDVHLMIERPDEHIEEFAKAGADSITFHAEATPHINRTLNAIRELGCLAGLAINPGTPVAAVGESVHDADVFLCMTVNPGWGGQPFIADSPDKVRRLASLVGDGHDRGRRRDRPGHRRRRRRRRGEPLRGRLRRLRRRRPRRRLQRHRGGCGRCLSGSAASSSLSCDGWPRWSSLVVGILVAGSRRLLADRGRLGLAADSSSPSTRWRPWGRIRRRRPRRARSSRSC